MLAVLGTSVFAQSQSDFLDPLDEERGRIERQGDGQPSRPAARPAPADAGEPAEGLLTRARDGAASGAAAAQDRATGLWARMKAAMAEVAESLGLPTAGLLGILGLALAGLACLVGWTLFRGRGRRGKPTKGADASTADGDLYDRSRGSRVRRRPGDTNPLTAKEAAVAAAPTADPGFEETMPEDFDGIFRDESAAKAETVSPQAIAPAATDDPATWKKPNLDKLRDSIKAEWGGKKKAAAATAGAGVAAAAGLATIGRADPARDPAAQSLSEVSDGWEEWDEQVKPEEDVWGETLFPGDDEAGEDAALRRIRALRESLRAS